MTTAKIALVFFAAVKSVSTLTASSIMAKDQI